MKIHPEAAVWTPKTVMVFRAAAASGAISSAAGLPSGIESLSKEEAEDEVTEVLFKGLKDSSSPGFQKASGAAAGGETAEEVNALRRQYLESLDVNPELVVSLGRKLQADAVLVTAIVRYGPEAEGDMQALAQSAETKVGASRLSISSAAPRAAVYYNVGFRCRLIRLSDAAVIWDVSVDKRQKRVALLDVTGRSVLEKAVSEVVLVFPYPKRDAPGRRVRDGV